MATHSPDTGAPSLAQAQVQALVQRARAAHAAEGKGHRGGPPAD